MVEKLQFSLGHNAADHCTLWYKTRVGDKAKDREHADSNEQSGAGSSEKKNTEDKGNEWGNAAKK